MVVGKTTTKPNKMADFNLDDPLLLTASQLRSRALEECRRRRAEASQKRRAEWERRNEEKERVRRVKEEWERENLLQSQMASQSAAGGLAVATAASGKDSDAGSDSSPDLMESPPPSPKYTAKKKPRRYSDSSNDRKCSTAKKLVGMRDKSTTKKSNRRSKLDRDSDSDGSDDVAGRKENASILRDGRYTRDSPRKYDEQRWKQDYKTDYSKSEHDVAPSKKTSRAKKKPWQMDSSDESEAYFDSLRKARQQKNQSQSQPNLNGESHQSNPKQSVKFSPKLATKKKHKYAESSSSSEDEAALEAHFKKRFEERQAKAALANRYSSSSGDTGIPKKFQESNTTKKLNRYSSSSGDSIPKKFEDQLDRKRYSSSSADSNIPKRFQEDSAPAAPAKYSKRSRLTQPESSSEDEAEMENRFRQSMEEKRLKSYKRNPLSQAKKDDDDWRVKMEAKLDGPRLHVSGQGLVGKEIVLGDEIKEVKDNVSDLGGSQERQRRVRRGQISSPDSPVAVAKKKTIEDDLWDDWDEDVKKTESESDEMPKKRGRKKAVKKDDWVDAKKKRVRSRPKKTDDDDSASLQPARKRPSPSKKNDDVDAPIARKRTGRGRHPDPKEESEESESDEEEEGRMAAQLKPNFANPKLGPPGPLEPFVLSKGDEDRKPTAQELENGVVTHQVPASMNRYLQDYQRTGIQFMYDSVIEGKGCVLGGKAVTFGMLVFEVHFA